MKKYLIISFIVIFCNTFSKAQLNDNSSQILNDVIKTTKSYSTIKINFTFKIEENYKTKSIKQGKFFIKNDKFYYNLEKNYVFSDGKTQWDYMADVNEVTITNITEDEETINPTTILNNYSKKYRTKLIREELETGILIQIIDLTPLKSKSYAKIRLIINKIKKQIIRMSIHDKEGSIYTYYIDKFVTNQNIDNSQFIFDTKKYPKIEINDLR